VTGASKTGGTTVTFSEAISSGFRNYVGFSGRAPRSEFWYWMLFSILVSIATSIIDLGLFSMLASLLAPSIIDLGSSHYSPFSTLWGLAVFLPTLAVGVRRLHDTDRSGWWWLIGIPLIGFIVLLVFWCSEGTSGNNRFGLDPLVAAREPEWISRLLDGRCGELVDPDPRPAVTVSSATLMVILYAAIIALGILGIAAFIALGI
jgi:uncharacterized membrane protein YhaH (DUF805 family)